MLYKKKIEKTLNYRSKKIKYICLNCGQINRILFLIYVFCLTIFIFYAKHNTLKVLLKNAKKKIHPFWYKKCNSHMNI